MTVSEPSEVQGEVGKVQWCPIENPTVCLGARCQLTGVCDHNRRLRALLSSTRKDERA